MTTLFVDVSHHDWDRRGGQLDWARVKAATSPVMCARATYGDPSGYSPDTRHFGDFQLAARAAGFTLRGGYHNLVHGDAASMKRQVAWFRSELDKYGCNWAMVDIERYPELVNNGLWPRFDDVLRFRDAWHAADPRPLAYYLPQWLWSGYYAGADLKQLGGVLIQSHYAGGDGTAQEIYIAAGGDHGTGWDDTYGGRTPDVWQYTSSGNVPGASGNTDCNAYRGTLTMLTALLTGDDMPTIAEILAADIDPGAGSYSLGGALITTLGRTGTIANTQLPTALATLTRLEAASAAQTAALQAMATAGGIEAAPIVAAVKAVEETIGAELGEVKAELVTIRAELEAARGEAEDLRRRLAIAYAAPETT